MPESSQAEPMILAAENGEPPLWIRPSDGDSGFAVAAGVKEPVWVRTLRQIVWSKNLASIGDQVLVSATNFLTTVLIGRAAGQDALGAYSLAFTVMLVVLCLQETLICVPYTIEQCKFNGRTRRQFAGSAFVQAALLAAVVTLVLAVGGLIVNRTSALLPTNLAIAIAVAAPWVLLRDFARRMSFARLAIASAIAVDALVLVLQLGVLVVFRRLGWLSASSAWFVIAVVCAIAGMLWLRSHREDFLPPGERLAADVRRSWSLGSWILGTQVVSILNAYLIYWLVAGSLGKHASGALFACSAIVLLSNPITLGTHTYLTPRLAAALASEGNAGARRVAWHSALFLAAVMSFFCVAAFTLGDAFLRFFYGEEFTGFAAVTGMYGLAVAAQAVGTPPEHVLRVKHRPAICFWTGIIGLGFMIVLAKWWLTTWGLLGGVAAIAFSNTLTAALRWIAMLRLTSPRSHATPYAEASN